MQGQHPPRMAGLIQPGPRPDSPASQPRACPTRQMFIPHLQYCLEFKSLQKMGLLHYPWTGAPNRTAQAATESGADSSLRYPAQSTEATETR